MTSNISPIQSIFTDSRISILHIMPRRWTYYIFIDYNHHIITQTCIQILPLIISSLMCTMYRRHVHLLPLLCTHVGRYCNIEHTFRVFNLLGDSKSPKVFFFFGIPRARNTIEYITIKHMYLFSSFYIYNSSLLDHKVRLTLTSSIVVYVYLTQPCLIMVRLKIHPFFHG